MFKGFIQYFLLIFSTSATLLTACTKPEPMAYRAKIGMDKKEVQKILGKPLYAGGFVASLDSGEAYVPQLNRIIRFQVFYDSSVVVFRRDTVVETMPNVRLFKGQIENILKKRRQQKAEQYQKAADTLHQTI